MKYYFIAILIVMGLSVGSVSALSIMGYKYTAGPDETINLIRYQYQNAQNAEREGVAGSNTLLSDPLGINALQ